MKNQPTPTIPSTITGVIAATAYLPPVLISSSPCQLDGPSPLADPVSVGSEVLIEAVRERDGAVDGK
jgi:hypothetical protein